MTLYDYLNRLEHKLELPYPQRYSFLRELKGNYLSYYQDLVAGGEPQYKAHKKALTSISLETEVVQSLADIHNTKIYKFYSRFTDRGQTLIELLVGSIPLILTFHYIKQEVPMMDLIQQGGAAMYPILAISFIAVIFQLKIIFSWFVAKNHSQNSLSSEQKLPMILGIGCFLLGLLGTLLGLYQSLHYAHTIANKAEFSQILAIGFSESIVSLIFATSALLIIFTLHFFTRYTAKLCHIPI